MVYFGDIAIPWVTSKDTSISGDLVEKNFVDYPPQVYQLTPDLEAGTYSFVLNETVQDKNESFQEQIDAVRSMDERHGCEFPFTLSGDQGHIVVNATNTAVTPSDEIRRANVDVRFLPKSDYRPSFVCTADPYSAAFSPTPEESVVALPSSVENVEVGGTSVSPDYTVTAEEGDFDYYIYSSRKIIEYDRESSTFGSDERVSPVRVYDSNSNRVYSTSYALRADSSISNGLLDVDLKSDRIEFDLYDSSSWNSFGSIPFGINYGHAERNENHITKCSFSSSYDIDVLRGLPVVGIENTGITSFDFNADSNITKLSEDNHYLAFEDGNGYDIIFVKTFQDGSFNVGTSTASIDSLTSSEEYYVYVGVVPTNITHADFARYIYNIGTQKRSFVQR